MMNTMAGQSGEDRKMQVSLDTLNQSLVHLRTLGEGNNGVAHLVLYEGHDCCLKIAKDNTEQDVKAYHREAYVLHKVDGAGGAPHLLLAAYDAPAFLTTFCPHPTLDQLLDDGILCTEEEILPVVHAVAVSLAAIHLTGFTHNDIKTDNILVDLTGPSAYIIDFGLSAPIGKVPKIFSQIDPLKRHKFPQYPPEILQSITTAPVSDVYTLGYVIKNLMVPNISPEFDSLLSDMIHPDMDARPSMDHVIQALDPLLTSD